jgi:hypothetical protein
LYRSFSSSSSFHLSDIVPSQLQALRLQLTFPWIMLSNLCVESIRKWPINIRRQLRSVLPVLVFSRFRSLNISTCGAESGRDCHRAKSRSGATGKGERATPREARSGEGTISKTAH